MTKRPERVKEIIAVRSSYNNLFSFQIISKLDRL